MVKLLQLVENLIDWYQR